MKVLKLDTYTGKTVEHDNQICAVFRMAVAMPGQEPSEFPLSRRVLEGRIGNFEEKKQTVTGDDLEMVNEIISEAATAVADIQSHYRHS